MADPNFKLVTNYPLHQHRLYVDHNKANKYEICDYVVGIVWDWRLRGCQFKSDLVQNWEYQAVLGFPAIPKAILFHTISSVGSKRTLTSVKVYKEGFLLISYI